MGYLSGFASRHDVISTIIKSSTYNSTTWTCLRHTAVGNTLWSVWEVTNENVTSRYIRCDLLRRFGPFNWAYKDMDESMGPFQYSCPPSYLDMVPEVLCADWREKVRAHHARKYQKLVVGQTVKLVGCGIPEVTVTSLRPLRGSYNGRDYRVPRRLLAPIPALTRVAESDVLAG